MVTDRGGCAVLLLTLAVVAAGLLLDVMGVLR